MVPLLDEHRQWKLIGYALHRATDSAVATMPALICISHFRAIIIHGKDIPGAILHTGPAKSAFIHINYRRHD